MPDPHALFEVSWEVCNKVGGIHTVVSTKAKTLVARFGDAYVAFGPWLLASAHDQFEEEQGFAAFSESCRALGVPVRVGRWKIPGGPRTILVEFSGLFAKKDAVLAGLWEHHKVDSLSGGWDYVEPVLFGHAAGIVIEKWYEERVAPRRQRAVAQFHDWMIGAGLLYLKQEAPEIGSVFTTHATILGRSIAAGGPTPEAGLAGRTPEEAAETHGVRAKHSMESVCAREADVFTTVSQITAREAELFLGRKADPLLPNGIDLDVIDELAGSVGRDETEARLRALARRMCAEDLSKALLLCASGRYEFHNKGLDILLDALALVDKKPGPPIVLFALVPAGNSGIRSEILERLRAPLESITEPDGICTHHLFDAEHDPILRRCADHGLSNARGGRVKVVFIPLYCAEGDGLLGLPYEAVLRGMQLTCFPSFYEPWGYTPEESLAVGVPTITTDCAGFGRWALESQLAPEQGVSVLPRENVPDARAMELLARMIERFASEQRDREEVVRTCRKTAMKTAWSDLVSCYIDAFDRALELSGARSGAAPSTRDRARVPLPVVSTPEGQRPRLTRFQVSASLPESLRGLDRLAKNLWWSWDPEATALFRDLYPARWESSRHNAVAFLRDIYPEDLAARSRDAKYLERLKSVLARFDAYMKGTGAKASGDAALTTAHPAAYFCAEFGVHESLRIYSGGLGALAGDHLKSASDLDLPLVAVGLFYRSGYVEQRLTVGGDQIAGAATNDPRDLPLELVTGHDGQPIEIEIGLPSSTLYLRAWKASIGREPLYLLDSDVEENRPEDRGITRQLYGGDHETRLRQEIALGRGGARLLARLGIEPSVWHLNEGHAAFVGPERAGRMVRELGLTFDEAREIVRASTLFTTHTPVPAGHDRFGEDLMRRYFSDAPAAFGVPWERFYEMGLAEDDRASFNMTYLAISFSSFVNGVSKLHGEVSRRLLRPYWPKLLEGEVPVRSVTNGVHLPTWTDPAIAGARDATALWDARRAARRRMLDRMRSSLERSFAERGDSPTMLGKMLAGLDPNALWIGFARRFAPYKRAQLLFRDPARLARLLSNPARPVRIVFGGKAHPHDQMGLDILKKVALEARSEPFLGRVFFLEDYDLDLARSLVQGADVWLNTPVRPMEASGTSGMKAAANGALNLSVLDGWWIEACDGKNGWSIGEGRARATPELQDELDGEHLYRLLEEEVAPLFHRRDDQGVPTEWLARVRHDLETIPTVFNTHRMVTEYRDRAYAPLASRWSALSRNGGTGARELSARNGRIRRGFGDVRIRAAHVADLTGLKVGDLVDARVEVELGPLTIDDVQVELVVGHQNGSGDVKNRAIVVLDAGGPAEGGAPSFEGSYRIDRSGGFAAGIRVRARASGDNDHALSDLVLWA
jgi:phosphorylase/glycogen(starch) synthase